MTCLRAHPLTLSTALLGLLLGAGSAPGSPQPTSNATGSADDVVLPSPPSAATPASAMRLPNLPALGDADQSSSPRADAPEPAPAPTIRSSSPAAIALQALGQRTGLSDAQLAALQAAQTRLARGDEAGALNAAQTLSAALEHDARSFVVGDGQNLFSIAGLPEVYANSHLWPLLWWANVPPLRQAWQLRKGMRLKVPAHPSVDEVSTALRYASTHDVLTAHLDDPDLPPGVIPH